MAARVVDGVNIVAEANNSDRVALDVKSTHPSINQIIKTADRCHRESPPIANRDSTR
jgi:hypothetical protein